MKRYLPVMLDHFSAAQPTGNARADLPGTKSVTTRIGALTKRIRVLGSDHRTQPGIPSAQLVPVLVPTFNNPTFVRSMLRQLRARNFANITVLDNASTYPAMLELLERLPRDIQVRRLDGNHGPRAAVELPEIWESLPSVFCLTDPDLRFNAHMPASFVQRLLELSERYACGKVGLALDISDPTVLRDEDFVIGDCSYKIWDWEAQFWAQELEPDVFRAPVDTTFALYNKAFFDPGAFLDALRVAGTFTCEHLPWRRDTLLPPDELEYYRCANRYSYYLGNLAPSR